MQMHGQRQDLQCAGDFGRCGQRQRRDAGLGCTRGHELGGLADVVTQHLLRGCQRPCACSLQSLLGRHPIGRQRGVGDGWAAVVDGSDVGPRGGGSVGIGRGGVLDDISVLSLII